MNNQEFDRLVSQIKNERVEESTIERAASRVENRIFGSEALALPEVHRLAGCNDFQALIPAYLGKSLSEARTLLFEDHMHQCVGCRRALGEARHGSARPPGRLTPAARPSSTVWQWGIAAGIAIAIGVGLFAAVAGILPGQHVARATVQNVDGFLYYVSDHGDRVLPVGYQISDGDEIRTGKGSNAVVRLLDGSLIEVRERSSLSVSRGWGGTTIHLDGQVIVQAAKQRLGHLYVATDDCLVSVKGTVFSVNHGTKGSRISVMEGVVKVDHGAQTQELGAGEQTTTSESLFKVPIEEEIAWSKDAARYLALLGELGTLRKQLESLPGPRLRYQSDLLQYVPDNTIVYAAIPNVGSTLGDANQLFEERLRQSSVLRDWWNQQQSNRGPKLPEVIERIRSFSSYLGNEVVIAVPSSGGQSNQAPVALAEVRQPGLRAFLEKLRQSDPEADYASLQIVDDLSSVVPTRSHPLFIYLTDNLVVASPDIAGLQRISAIVRRGGTTHQPRSPFLQRVAQSYQQGAGWLLSVNVEQILADSVHNREGRKQAKLPLGLDDMKYLMVERRETGGKTENRAFLTFASPRKGIASWLAAPGPMGSLDFVSPDASLVAAFVIKNPRSVMEEIFQAMQKEDPRFGEHLAELESRAGVSILSDVTAPLGGEVTVAFDGPPLPTPSWKCVIEVYDSQRLQWTIPKLLDSFNQQAPPDAGKLQLTTQQTGSQTYFTVRNDKYAAFEVHYTFVDSYLIAAPNQALLTRAIQNRQTGYTLTHSANFRSQLPSDAYTNFSAILYHNLGAVLTPLAQQLKNAGPLTPEQQQSLDAFAANSSPGLIYAYGEPDRIVLASNSSFMGLNLGTLLGTSAVHPFLMPPIFSPLLGERAGQHAGRGDKQ